MTDPTSRLASALASRYTIERKLGAGGMAMVYLARDLKHDRQVAIKVLRPDIGAVIGAERFLQEIRVTARLRHPHILPLYDSGKVGRLLYYVTPVVEGGSLRDRLAREKQLPMDDAIGIAREIADALSYAHSHDVVHRDIKPENILLESGHAVVADFGIARAISVAGGQTLSDTGVAIGTPPYMSPEQAAGERTLDGRSDLYALGCVLYEMLAGQPPFTGPTAESLIRQHRMVEAPSITGIRPAVPVFVAAAIQRALAKTPADRFHPVALFAEALLEGPPVRPAARTRYRRIALVSVIVVAVALAWFGWRALRPVARSITFINWRQVTHDPALEIQAAISPDGKEVAYASGYPCGTHIEVRDVTQGRALRLTADWQGRQTSPRWTPDGRSVRFVNDYTTADHGSGVWTMPRMGGQAVAAGPGGTVAITSQRALEQRGDSVFARDADGSETLLYAGAEFHSPRWSPDGSQLAFVVGNNLYQQVCSLGNIAPSAIWVVMAGGAPVRVTDDRSLNVSPAWLSNGELLFISNRDGPRDLYAVQLASSGRPLRPPVRLTTGLDAFSISVSADGATVVYDRFVFRRNIYSLPIPRTGSVSIRAARPLTRLNQTIELLAISQDGKWLAFDSNLDGNQDVFVMPAAGGEPRRVTRDPQSDFGPDFSPDGREIAFYSTRNGPRDVYLINFDGTGERRLTSDSIESSHPFFSPDGLRIAYTKPPGLIYILRRDTIGGAWSPPELLATNGFRARWSPDGLRLVFERYLDSLTSVHTVTLSGDERLLTDGSEDGLQNPGSPVWSADGRSVYLVATAPDGVTGVYEFSAAGRSPRLLVRFDDPALDAYRGGGLVFGNGRFYFTIGEMESDIYVMDVVRH